jgi:hypothetical protein
MLMFPSSPLHLEPDLRRHPRVIEGAVVLPEEGCILQQVPV